MNSDSLDDIASWLPKKYDLDKEVSVWSDFLHTHYHPRSIILLEGYHHNDENERFDFFGCGIQTAQKDALTETIQDRIRVFTEECDYLQGFQLLMDGYNGFAGVSSSVLLHLEEEYGQKTQICYPVFEPTYRNVCPGEARSEETYRLLTSVLCYNNLISSSSLFSPLSLGSQSVFQAQQQAVHFDHLSYKQDLPYHTSAILALALEILSFPSRLKVSPTHLRDFAHQMTYGNRKLVSGHLCLPLPLRQGQKLLDFFSQSSNRLIKPLTPLCHSQNTLIQSLVSCGIPEESLGKPISHQDNTNRVEEIIAKYLSTSYPSAALFLKNITPPCKVVAPFPHIFSSHVGGNGLIQSSPRMDCLGVQSVPVLAAYRNSTSCSEHVEDMIKCAKKININKFHRCLETDIERDDIKEAINNLESFADNYTDSGFLIEG